ncbi:MAG: MBL fold metallo-hydrolase [Eubacteriales bacterium]|nr:MBL fold metallo-hydrolase [Eubacteriales bacterium]
MIRFVSLGSGSTGNCSLIDNGSTRILIDAGLGVARIRQSLRALGVELRDLDGVLITHEHIDHIRALASLVNRAGVPVYGNDATLAAAQRVLKASFPDKAVRLIRTGEDFYVRDLAVRSFRTSHDAVASVGYSVFYRRAKICLVTDTGYLTQEIGKNMFDASVLLLESNHDERMLREGPYPARLKQRILSRKGHLSNDAAADAVRKLIDHNVRCVLLGHLSQTNNLPEKAYGTVEARLTADGIDTRLDVDLSVAPPDTLSRIYTIGD